MKRDLTRGEFLKRAWKAGAALIAGAGIWTTTDVLQPLEGSGLGGVIGTVPPSEVPNKSAIFVRSAQTYLTEIDNEVVALYQRCPHLGCRVAWCDSSGEFECACHGSTFNRAGEVRTGPSPRGMDRFAVNVSDEVVEVDTGVVIEGPRSGSPESLDEPPRGEGCAHA